MPKERKEAELCLKISLSIFEPESTAPGATTRPLRLKACLFLVKMVGFNYLFVPQILFTNYKNSNFL